MADIPDNQGTADRGRGIVARELERRGARDIREVRGKNRRMLECVAPDGRHLGIIVKTRRSGTWQTSINEGDIAKADVRTFWIFVDLEDERHPFFHVVPDGWIRENIARDHQLYLDRHGGHRAVTDDSTHHAIEPRRIRDWRARWDLLGMK